MKKKNSQLCWIPHFTLNIRAVNLSTRAQKLSIDSACKGRDGAIFSRSSRTREAAFPRLILFDIPHYLIRERRAVAEKTAGERNDSLWIKERNREREPFKYRDCRSCSYSAFRVVHYIKDYFGSSLRPKFNLLKLQFIIFAILVHIIFAHLTSALLYIFFRLCL